MLVVALLALAALVLVPGRKVWLQAAMNALAKYWEILLACPL